MPQRSSCGRHGEAPSRTKLLDYAGRPARAGRWHRDVEKVPYGAADGGIETSTGRSGQVTAGIRPGPWETLRIAGADVPLYVMPFDAQGVLQAPLTAARLSSCTR